MSSELELLIQLKNQLVSFLDELIESFPTEPDFVIFRIFVKDKIPVVDIMQYITTKIIPLQDMIIKEDDNFFINNNVLFEKFDEKKSNKVNHFKRLWQSDNVDEEDKQVIWRWFKSFLYLANRYLELKNTHQ